jgi:signal transduction histidine kinase/CheY-like chemotaxis protein
MTRPVGLHAHDAALISATPSRKGMSLAVAFVIVSLLVFLAAIPLVRLPLQAIPSFIPGYETGLFVVELISAMLLLAQYTRTASTRMLILASGYAFNTVLIVVHMLSFPGAFAPNGVIGGASQTTAWLYSFWHGGFPLFVIAYALIYDRPKARTSRQIRARAIGALTGAMGLAAVCAVMTVVGHDWLPVIVEHGNYAAMVHKGVSPIMIAMCVLAIALLIRRRTWSTLDLWVAVVMSIWILDISMSAVLGSSRYDLGWYLGRLFGFIAGTFVLILLLWQANSLYQDLNDALILADEREKALSHSRDELARAQRLEAIGKLTGGIAHDFNNLLQVVGGNLFLLNRECAEQPRAVLLIERAQKGVAQGTRLSSELLAFARKQPMKKVTVDVGHLIESLDEMLTRTLGETIEYHTYVADDVWHAIADPALLESALLNLTINARDAMPAGGKLTIKASNTTLDEKYASQHPDAPQGQFIAINVTDTGSGIAEDVLPHILEPFFTTKPVGKGTGLGLSMVYGFAKQNNGHLEISSTLGVGTSITLFLPRSDFAVTLVELTGAESVTGGAETILIVDDNDEVRTSLVQILQSLGYAVIEASDASDALDVLQAGSKIDVLLTDVVLPGQVTVRDLVAQAETLLPDLPIVFASGDSEEGISDLIQAATGRAFLKKPFQVHELTSAIQHQLSAVKYKQVKAPKKVD